MLKVSGRPAGSLQPPSGRSTGWPTAIATETRSGQEGTGAGDAQLTVTPATHGCQSGSASIDCESTGTEIERVDPFSTAVERSAAPNAYTTSRPSGDQSGSTPPVRVRSAGSPPSTVTIRSRPSSRYAMRLPSGD